jgi:hypothetical protein
MHQQIENCTSEFYESSQKSPLTLQDPSSSETSKFVVIIFDTYAKKGLFPATTCHHASPPLYSSFVEGDAVGKMA